MPFKMMNSTVPMITFLPPANEVWGKVMFSQVFVYPRGGWSAYRGGGLPTGRKGSAYEAGCWTPPRSIKVGGTHPTGILSCYFNNVRLGVKRTEKFCFITGFYG